MMILNRRYLLRRLRDADYASISDFCAQHHIHRNSVSQYLNGKGVLQPVVQLLFEKLHLERDEALLETVDSRSIPELPLLSRTIDRLVSEFPAYSYILFGSRARGKARTYSDVDLGVVGNAPLSLDVWSGMRNIVDETSEDLPYMVDLVDLKRADHDFLSSVRTRAVFLGGSLSGWQELQKQ